MIGDPDPIIGETILGLDVQEDGTRLVFTCVGARYVYSAFGDCCSSTWVEHMTVPPDIVGAVVTGRTDPELPPHEAVEEGNEYDVIQVYHTAWQTTHGEVIAEYRNSSNGYYGGSLDGPAVEVL